LFVKVHQIEPASS